MSELIFFFLLFFIFLFCTTCTIVGPYVSSYIAWFKYAKNCQDIFNKEENLNNLSLIIDSHKCKSLIIFTIFNLFNIIVLAIFLWIWISGRNNIILDGLHFIIKILFKKLEVIGVDSNEIAINNFKIYQENFKTNLKVSKFKLYKSDQIALRNKPFQFNQWRYKNKIRRLNNKKSYNAEKYNLKLLNLYIRYLKTYAIFFKAMESDSKSNDDYYVVIEEQKSNSLESLKKTLITNFFAYVNEIKKQ